MRAFSYIGDIAPLIADSINISAAYNQIFNIGADQPCSINDLAIAIADSMKVKPIINYLPARSEVLFAYSSHEKIQQVFGVRQETRLEEGLARMANWVYQHGTRASKEFEGIEVMKNFPQAWLPQVAGLETE